MSLCLHFQYHDYKSEVTHGGGGGGGHSHINVLPTRVHQPLKWTLNGILIHHVAFAPLNGIFNGYGAENDTLKWCCEYMLLNSC